MRIDYVIFVGLVLLFLFIKLCLWRKITWTAIFISLGICCHFTIIEYDWGVASPRVYLFFVAIALFFLRVLRGGLIQHASSHIKWIVFLWIIFSVWLLLSNIFRGELTNSILINFISDYLISICIFLVISIGLKWYHDYKLLSLTLVAVALINIIVAIGQWLNFMPAWHLYEILRPLAYESRGVSLDHGLAYSRIAGISGSPITLSYVILGFSSFFLGSVFFLKRRNILLTLGNAFFATLAIGTLFLTLTRSAVMSGVLQIATGVFLWIYYRRNIPGQRMITILGIICAASLAILIMHAPLSEKISHFDFSRLSEYKDTYRWDMLNASLDSFLKKPLLGPGINGFSNEMGTNMVHPPHNLFLNAMVLLGLPGLLVVITTTYYIFHICFLTARFLKEPNEADWIIAGSLLGIVGYFANSFFHNEGLVSGGFLLYILLGICLGVQKIFCIPIHNRARIIKSKTLFRSAIPT
jgi:hypothetical protein